MGSVFSRKQWEEKKKEKERNREILRPAALKSWLFVISFFLSVFDYFLFFLKGWVEGRIKKRKNKQTKLMWHRIRPPD